MGRRQADAAWEAGRSQADAQLDVARQTLTAQHLASQREVRRAAYATFLTATDVGHQRRIEWQRASGTSRAVGCRDRYRAAPSTDTEALALVRLAGASSGRSAPGRL